MIVGYTDRVLRIFRWVNTNHPASSAINSNSFSNINNKSSSGTLNSSNYNYTIQDSGKFILEQTWELPDQVSFFFKFKNYLYIFLFKAQFNSHFKRFI